MSDIVPAGPGGLRLKRDATISRLCEHFALDHLDAEQLERLIDRAHASATPAELDALLEGLPALVDHTAAEPALVVPSDSRQTVVAIMGGAERKGAWISSRRLHVVALMGGAVLDFREVRLPAGVTELEIVAVMGGVEVIVPPGLRVLSDGFGILGGFAHTGARPGAERGADTPTLKVTGVAFMGGVEITQRRPGEAPSRRGDHTRGKLHAG